MGFSVFLLGAATLLPLVSNPIGANSPVKIKSCDVAYIEDTGAVMTSELQYTNGVTVKVQNASDKPVTSFTVAGSYNTYHVVDTWSGNLLPGAQLSIYKHYQQLPYVSSQAKCRVTKVTYADGSTWSATEQP
jgi:hypothetical protein